MNKFICIGRLTKDPELRYTQSEIAVANFDIAVNRRFSDKDGNKITDFFRVIVWRKQGENVKKYCKKGDMVAVEGEIQIRDYENEKGEKRRITEIISNSVMFLNNKREETQEEEETEEVDPYKQFGEEIELTDDDIAF